MGGSSERVLVRENELSNTGSAFSKFASYKTSYTNLISDVRIRGYDYCYKIYDARLRLISSRGLY